VWGDRPLPGVSPQDNATKNGVKVTRAAAVKQVIDRLATGDAVAKKAAALGYTVSEAEITAYLTDQVNKALQLEPAGIAAVWAANGNADADAYVHDPNVRAIAARLITGGRMLSDMAAADPKFDAKAFTTSLRATVKTTLRFTP